MKRNISYLGILQSYDFYTLNTYFSILISSIALYCLCIEVYVHHEFNGHNVHLILMDFYAETINCVCAYACALINRRGKN